MSIRSTQVHKRPSLDLAARLTKWSTACDRKLHRLVSYINSTPDIVLVGWVGDEARDLFLKLFVDADYAGDRLTKCSTSGVLQQMFGPRTQFPLHAGSQGQKVVSTCTAESEIVAAHSGVKNLGLPSLDIWDTVLERPVICVVQEDNDACLSIIKSGKNPALRHVPRTHDITSPGFTSVSFLAEWILRKSIHK